MNQTRYDEVMRRHAWARFNLYVAILESTYTLQKACETWRELGKTLERSFKDIRLPKAAAREER